MNNLTNQPEENSERKTQGTQGTEVGRLYTTPTTTDLSEAQKNQVKDLFRPELESEVRDIKKDFITIFGLFAALVTFLSIEVQIFKSTNNVTQLIGLTIITTAMILLFTIIINDIVKDRSKWNNFFSPTYALVIVFLGVGTFLLVRSQNSVKVPRVITTNLDSTNHDHPMETDTNKLRINIINTNAQSVIDSSAKRK